MATDSDRSGSGSTRAWRKKRAEVAALLPMPCSVCELPVLPTDDWHLDHVTARVLGGTSVWPAHAKCNLQKGARMVSKPAYVDPTILGCW